MDLINNLLYSALLETVDQGATPIKFPAFDREFIALPVAFNPKTPTEGSDTDSFYKESILEEFVSFDDMNFIDKAIQKHWTDMVFRRLDYIKSIYGKPDMVLTTFTIPGTEKLLPLYHMIYAYLVENTRIAQIFAKVVFSYMHDEKLQKADKLAFQWIVNTENLFFKTLSNSNFRNITSQLRLYEDKTRRNAYYRMFGMDLAFGDMDTNQPIDFYKSEVSNQSFIILFEKFISEIWQAYINARNTSGPNTTDLSQITDAARLLQEMLMSRRTTVISDNIFENYRYFNLSREEYSSVVMMSWFYYVITYNSPVVRFLSCDANTPAERLANIGKKVGVSTHSRSEELLDLAPVMSTLLRKIELADYNQGNVAQVQRIIESQVPGRPASSSEKQALVELLLIINNWEKATGHKIKNREANISGVVKVQQNGVKPTVILN